MEIKQSSFPYHKILKLRKKVQNELNNNYINNILIMQWANVYLKSMSTQFTFK